MILLMTKANLEKILANNKLLLLKYRNHLLTNIKIETIED